MKKVPRTKKKQKEPLSPRTTTKTKPPERIKNHQKAIKPNKKNTKKIQVQMTTKKQEPQIISKNQ